MVNREKAYRGKGRKKSSDFPKKITKFKIAFKESLINYKAEEILLTQKSPTRCVRENGCITQWLRAQLLVSNGSRLGSWLHHPSTTESPQGKGTSLSLSFLVCEMHKVSPHLLKYLCRLNKIIHVKHLP